MSELTLEEIVLTDEEAELLRILSDNGAIVVEEHNRKALRRLEHFHFAEIFYAPKEGERFDRKGAKVTERGRDYLAYADALTRAERRDFRRDALMLLLGSAITVLTEHLPGLVSFLAGLFQRG